MKSYELTCLVKPESSLEELKGFQEKIIGLLQKQNGVLEKARNTQKITLGYEIKETKEAHLVVFQFKMLPEKLIDLKKGLDIEDSIIRYLILNKKEEKKVIKKEKVENKKMSTEKEETKEEIEKEIEEETKKRKPLKEKKVEIGDLDKKLEEILGE